MLLYAGYKECAVRLFAGMPVCYIYSQQGGRQWSCPMAGRTNMKDKKLEEAVDYVCSCCPYIFSGSAEWDKSNPAFADGRDSATKYCDRCMVRKMTDFYNALDEHEFSEGMPEYQAIVNY
jgi:hypothetical protein